MSRKRMNPAKRWIGRRKTLALVFLAVLFGLVLPTWQKNLQNSFRARRDGLERRHREMVSAQDWLNMVLARRQSAGELRRKIGELGLPLVEPGEWNIHYLEDAEAETGPREPGSGPAGGER